MRIPTFSRHSDTTDKTEERAPVSARTDAPTQAGTARARDLADADAGRAGAQRAVTPQPVMPQPVAPQPVMPQPVAPQPVTGGVAGGSGARAAEYRAEHAADRAEHTAGRAATHAGDRDATERGRAATVTGDRDATDRDRAGTRTGERDATERDLRRPGGVEDRDRTVETDRGPSRHGIVGAGARTDQTRTDQTRTDQTRTDADRAPVVAGPKPRASLLATLGLITGVAGALLVLSGPLLGYGIGVAGLALVLSVAGIRATGKRHVAGKTDALIGMVLALAAIVVGVLALTGSLSWLGTDMQPVTSVREWLDAQFIDRF
ncbi:hypothetical protein CLV70_103347 [Pseudosporangium ferrugineum]|uniref:Thrombospondin n=1 Tax=Pseudosporangium ferrugineum TaxID=439699 RepID=A0A2T0SDG1_9ACTN|nr:hypothetical protein CLV70_103347 [Pseudosporangium ferrugineum]